jgi:primosomal protein N' (replication factor Y)
VPPLKDELRRFVDWVSTYTLSPRGMVLRMGLRMGEHLGPARERVGVRLAGPPPKRRTPARQRVLTLWPMGSCAARARRRSRLAFGPG